MKFFLFLMPCKWLANKEEKRENQFNWINENWENVIFIVEILIKIPDSMKGVIVDWNLRALYSKCTISTENRFLCVNHQWQSISQSINQYQCCVVVQLLCIMYLCIALCISGVSLRNKPNYTQCCRSISKCRILNEIWPIHHWPYGINGVAEKNGPKLTGYYVYMHEPVLSIHNDTYFTSMAHFFSMRKIWQTMTNPKPQLHKTRHCLPINGYISN